jgi:hypothetical protein
MWSIYVTVLCSSTVKNVGYQAKLTSHVGVAFRHTVQVTAFILPQTPPTRRTLNRLACHYGHTVFHSRDAGNRRRA